MSKQSREIKKRMLAKRTLNELHKQIEKLDEQKAFYIEKAKIAKRQGIESQYHLAVSALKNTLAQQKRAQEMTLNFEITTQMKDMSKMTKEFVKGMGALSKDMRKMTSEKHFAKMQREFEKGMVATEMQTMNMESFLQDSRATFKSQAGGSKETDAEIEAMILEQAGQDDIGSDTIDAELENIRSKMQSKN